MKLKDINLASNVVRKKKTSFSNNTAVVTPNEAINLQEKIQEAIDDGSLVGLGGGGGATNLTVGTRTSTTMVVESSTGIDATLPSATTSQAGLLSSVDKTKLDGLSNYTHPNHSGDVVSTGDGATVIQTNVVSNNKLADMPANTVKVRNANTTGDPVDLAIANNQLVGRGSTGDITPITLGTNLSMTGSTLNATGGGSGNTNLAESNRTATTVDITSDTGTDATLSPATPSLAGVMSAADKTKTDFITVTQAVNLDTVELHTDNHTTLNGVAATATNLGTFTGTTIPDNQTIKQTFQTLETAIEAGDTVTNGLTGNGRSATPHKLGGSLSENTTINGTDFNFILNNAGVIQLESDSTTGTHRTEITLSGDNTIGGYFRHTEKATPTRFSQLFLDNDNTMGLTYSVTPGQAVGFEIVPNTTTATSKAKISTTNSALGTSATGQVLTLQADGTVEYQTITSIIDVESDNTIIRYQIATGTPVVTASRAAGIQTINVTGGTIKLISLTTKGVIADLAGDQSFKIVANGVIGSTLLAYPLISKWNLNPVPPTESVPNVQDIDNTPQVQITGGTAGSSITIRVINLNAFTDWVIKAIW